MRTTYISLFVLLAVSAGAFFAPILTAYILAEWVLLSLTAVAVAYCYNWPMLFRKKHNGAIPSAVRWVFFPFLLGAHIYNAWARKTDTLPPTQHIDTHLFMGCRLTRNDVDRLDDFNIDALLDLTAEFDGLGSFAQYDSRVDYLNIPLLDHMPAKPHQINQACRWVSGKIAQNKNVMIHCALGRGRASFMVSAVMLYMARASSVEEAMQVISTTRTKARLNSRQTRALMAWHQDYVKAPDSQHQRTLAIIANPVAGRKQWQTSQQDVLNHLAPYFKVVIYTTTKKRTAFILSQKAIAKGAEVLVACGGDGTVQEVASVAVEANVPLGIIPLGTANSLANVYMGFKTKFTPIDTACNAIINGHVRHVDIGQCNGEYFLLAASLGIEKSMIENAKRTSKNSLGQFAYIQTFFSALADQKARSYWVSFDNEPKQLINTKSIMIANAAPITSLLAQGGGELIFDDGLLDVTWIDETQSTSTYYDIGALALTAFTNIKMASSIGYKKCKKITLTPKESASAQPLHYILDGESRSHKKIQTRIIHKGLHIFSVGS